MNKLEMENFLRFVVNISKETFKFYFIRGTNGIHMEICFSSKSNDQDINMRKQSIYIYIYI